MKNSKVANHELYTIYEDGRIHEWKEETARKRKNTALKNLEIINARN